MRFLLHPTTQRATSQGIRQGRTAQRAKDTSPSSVVSASSSDRNHVQSWGQQCSPNCGCVVRFEATLDPASNKFTSATYHAKSVIVTKISNEEDGTMTLKPAMTLRTNRPMFRPCSCDSLHQLASRVAEYLPNQNAHTFGSSMEFSGVRSSPAFRHTVLEKQGLPTEQTHCFDVVEEALTAMVKGHMPKSREQIPFKQVFASSSSSSLTSFDYSERGLETEEEDQFRIDMSSFKLAPPRGMSALELLDVNAKYSPFGFDKESPAEEETRYSSRRKKDSGFGTKTKTRAWDWQSYVDELLETNEIQKSA